MIYKDTFVALLLTLLQSNSRIYYFQRCKNKFNPNRLQKGSPCNCKITNSVLPKNLPFKKSQQ